MTQRDDLVKRLRARSSEDHARGCQGRCYACDCGFDMTNEGLFEMAADEIDRLTAALAEHVVGWQQIETAPKDGHEILGWWSGSRAHTIISWSSAGWWKDCADDSAVSPPTHWQPLIDGPTVTSSIGIPK